MPLTEKVSAKKPSIYYPMEIIKEFDETETQFWDLDMPMGVQHPVCSYYEVPLQCRERTKIENIIVDKMSCETVIFDRIQRIQNPYLMATFLLSKNAYAEEHGYNRVKSRWLLHGTKRDAIPNIVKYNFDLNIIERDRYGHGIYFTPDIAFAKVFCNKKGQKEAILARVLQCITCTGDEDMDVPDDGCDTSINETPKNQQVVVKYDDDTFYPAYRICFTLK